MTLHERLTIRPAMVNDLDVLTEFSAAMALETEHRRLDKTRLRAGTQAVIERPEHGRFYVAELLTDGCPIIVGQFLITYEWSDWRNAQFWWVQSVYVRPDWRRKGVYRRMHQLIESLARSQPDVCGIRLYVERDNETAKHVYERVGLHAAGYEVYESDFVLSKAPAGS